ncbi:MAG: Rne/Rng family ribonuclease [Clostridiaceae bacterium]|nr:Rne/Rng family ribonuclease [Clostridiaceae bacterium]
MQELIVIQKQDKSKQICLAENGILKEYYEEIENKKCLEGNVYIGKIENVLPGMQAAFVDIGEEKKAFLHIRDILPKKSTITGNKNEEYEKYKIQDYIKPNQCILVQVKKDINNLKGPRISTHIQIPGRFIVLLPENDFITASQKIENNEEKKRLIDIVSNIKKDEKIGVIIRTAAEGKDEQQIERDIKTTIEKWKKLQEDFKKEQSKAPKILKKSETILEKILLDIADNKLEKILVNDELIKEKIEEILKEIKEEKDDIIIEMQKQNLEDKYDMQSQIEKIQNRKIWLKCGGFITIDKTEALTAIDVNSGKFTGNENLEKTVLKVNKEASCEIAKQLRLRDIGGIIIIDYIDMEEESSKEEVLDTLKINLKEDRAKIQIMQFTKLNLLEMTRKHMFGKE